ncbi:Zn-dependent hydrolase [Mangrovicella endophytica]|uniref:Zn-dependent hydrolase n=1 Tax=Mangrovicella endophytica TaxID=2066697 RepID=UPI001FDF2E97|nr:Zn-dependent hydrolase [Mangrovicella endophytica]
MSRALSPSAGDDIQIDGGMATRLLDELAARTADAPGVTRAAYGEGERFAHALVRREGEALGLAASTDAAGNLYLTLPGRNPALPGWIVGSHLDSVPHGGNYDGAAGVVAGLLAVEALISAGLHPQRSVTVMAIRAEESNWFPVSYLGSRAAFGVLPPESLHLRRSDSGQTLADFMSEEGFRPEAVAAGERHLDPARIHAFVEVHIEQGPVLEAAKLPVGLVTAIAGSFRYRQARCLGAWGHSGAVPRAHRRDTVFALAELVTALDRLWGETLAGGEEATVTLGEVGTDRTLHGFSTIPGAVAFSLDVRSSSPACVERLHQSLLAIVAEIETRRGVRFELGTRTQSQPAILSPVLRQSFAATARAASIPTIEMMSGAGHDTATFANQGVPAALLFVRNQNGSHNPDEAMRIEDLLVAAELVARRIAADDEEPMP